MSVSGAARQMRSTGKRVFGIIRRSVSAALATQELDKQLSVDETSRRKGHAYLTVLCDRDSRHLRSVKNALIDMEVRGAYREKVRSVTMDMSKAYIAAVVEYFENADITFDRFHLSKKLNEAIARSGEKNKSTTKT